MGVNRSKLEPQSAALLDRFDRLKASWSGRIAGEGLAASRLYAEEVFETFRCPERDRMPAHIERLVIPTRHEHVGARHYRSAREDGACRPGCVLFLHGGGWSLGSLDAYDGLAGSIAGLSGQDVVSLDYALAPENPFPVAVEQAEDALQWLAERAGDFAFDPARLSVMGDSAGGNLAAVIARRAALAGGTRLASQVLLYPMTDVASAPQVHPSRIAFGTGDLFLEEAGIEGAAQMYVPGDDGLRGDPDVSPLMGEPPAGLARALVLTAGLDPLRDEGRAYHCKLEEAGIESRYRECEGTFHAFLSFGALDIAQRARREIADFLRGL